MPEIGKWNGHTFVVSPTLIRSFGDLTFKGSSQTEEKTSSSQKYVARKNSGPMEVSLTVQLSALVGCDPRTEAMAFVKEAADGAQGYFYIAGKKLMPCQLMLTEATVTDIEMTPQGAWVSCNVKLGMKQAGKWDGVTENATAKGSKKQSVKQNVLTAATAALSTATSKVTLSGLAAAKKAVDAEIKKKVLTQEQPAKITNAAKNLKKVTIKGR